MKKNVQALIERFEEALAKMRNLKETNDERYESIYHGECLAYAEAVYIISADARLFINLLQQIDKEVGL